MTIWALALLAASARAAVVVPVKAGGRAAPVTAVPALAPALGGGAAAGVSVGGADLRASFPTLPAPEPGLAPGAPAAALPPGAFGFRKHDAPSSVSAPSAAPGLVPDPGSDAAPAPGSPRRAPGILPEGPASGGLLPAALPTRAADAFAPPAPAGVEAAAATGRGLFDNEAARPAVDASRFAAPAPSARSPYEGLRASLGGAGTTGRSGAGVSAVEARGGDDARTSTGYVPDAALAPVLPVLPGGASREPGLRDAVASPALFAADPLAAGLRGGHAPLLARPSRLTLAGTGLVLRVTPVPAADPLLRGRPAWTAAPAEPAPAARPLPARRLVSTELIERGALLEAVSASDSYVGRGLLGLAVGDLPGAIAGVGRARVAAAPASAPAPAPGRRGGAALGLAFLPLAALIASRRLL